MGNLWMGCSNITDEAPKRSADHIATSRATLTAKYLARDDHEPRSFQAGVKIGGFKSFCLMVQNRPAENSPLFPVIESQFKGPQRCSQGEGADDDPAVRENRKDLLQAPTAFAQEVIVRHEHIGALDSRQV